MEVKSIQEPIFKLSHRLQHLGGSSRAAVSQASASCNWLIKESQVTGMTFRKKLFLNKNLSRSICKTSPILSQLGNILSLSAQFDKFLDFFLFNPMFSFEFVLRFSPGCF